MSDPEVSVVIPAYNASRTIGATIESVLAQTWNDLELVVVDDGSSDDTPERVEEFASDPRLRLVRQPNQGVAGARNTGVGLSRGAYVSLLDNDDLWMPNYLATVVDTFRRHPEAGLVYTDAWSLDDVTGRIRRGTAMERQRPPRESPLDPQAFLRLLVRDNFINPSATIRRSILEELGGFDPTVTAVDDYDLWLRIVIAGYPAVRAPGLLVIQRDKPDSQSKDETLMMSRLRAVLAKAAQDPRLPADASAVLRRRIGALDQDLEAARGERPVRHALLRLRRFAGVARRRVVGKRRWYAHPPAEVAAAFPDLPESAATLAATKSPASPSDLRSSA